jgi:DNA-directed RNA polymerase subunit B'
MGDNDPPSASSAADTPPDPSEADLIEGGGKEETSSPIKFFSEVIPPNEELHNYYKVYLNGTLIGVVPRGEAPSAFVAWLRDQRKSALPFNTGVSVDHAAGSILINTDAGRLLIPLIPAKYVLDPKHREEFQVALAKVSALLASQATAPQAWEFLLANGFVELYDQVMIENAVVAHSVKDLFERSGECTHLQLPDEHCGIIMSLVGSADMNKGARNIYICNHWKQGIGGTIWNPFARYLGESNLLRGPQRPLVRSAFNEIIGLDRYPFCQNVDVAFLAMADNQSDALTFNQAAIDRGVFVVHHIEFQMIVPDSPNAAFGVPDFAKVYSPVAPMDAYLKVDPVLGTPKTLGQKFKHGDIIAAITKPLSAADIEGLKKMKTKDGKEISYTLSDVSISCTSDHCPNERHPTYSMLVSSFSSVGQNERVRLLQFETTRFAKSGDKFSSEHGQKGVCGVTMQEWEVPYNEDGIRATILFNPPAAVRRETHGQLPFALLGKICALYGTSLDHTPFMNQVYTEQMSGLLSELGMDPRGTEKMTDPTTGIPYANPIYFGVLAYMQLRRMVDDLVQYRYNGPREWFSRMPVKGRVRRGGVMFDEMTRNAAMASGATITCRDCMFTQVAPSEYQICDKCHQYAYPSPMTPGVTKCDRCGNLDPAVSHTVWLPYNATLLYSILSGAGCKMETLTDSSCTLAGQIPEEPFLDTDSVEDEAKKEQSKEKEQSTKDEKGKKKK